MLITEVEIDFVKPKDGLIAFASIILEGQLYLSGIAIHRKLDGSGHRLTYPTRKLKDSQVNIFHPIRKLLSVAIEQAVFQKLKDVVSKLDVGHHSTDSKSPRV